MKFKNFRKNFDYYFDKLWSLNRSLTGDDVRKTHQILSEIIKLRTYEVKSGKKVHDWKVPDEWNVKEAYIADERGKKIVDFKKNNLHLASYSIPFSGYIKKQQLKKKLYFIKKMPNAIPYKTLYYKNDWGFCLSYNQFKKLKNEKFYINIKTSLKKGSMTLSEIYLPGLTKKEILIHSYTCHPSLAINELSGPITAALLANELSKKKQFYSFRFLFLPETIGSITFLSRKGEFLKKNLKAGFICNSIGYKDFITYKKSKISNSIGDLAAINIFKKFKNKNMNISDFNPSGSDERQYCSIGYNLPVGVILSKLNYNYKEYHTSLDNKKILNYKNLYDVFKIFLKIFREIKKLDKINKYKKKNNRYIKHKIKGNPLMSIKKCEPQLSKYKIHYKTLDAHAKADRLTLASKWLIHYSNGFHSIEKISQLSKIPKKYFFQAYKSLKKAKIISKI